MRHSKYFSGALINWDITTNVRQMPWKGEKDPYKIWISEIILQQTRVQQGLDYYNRFIEALPDIKSLADAPEQKVFKLWEGLGYYTRCKNLIASARFIQSELKGKFPDKYEDILELKGIGPYTAAAISSFAFNQPYAVLDGNVFRILSRFFGEETPVNTPTGKKLYATIAEGLLNKKHPGAYNQAIMDFGALICKPANPLCLECPLQKRCIAFLENKVSQLPVNNKIIKLKERYFNYLIVEYKNRFYIRKRTEKDIWQNLYEFILIETKELADEKTLLQNRNFISLFGKINFTIKKVSDKRTQKLTHRLIAGKFFYIVINEPLLYQENYELANKSLLKKLPFPKFIVSYLADKNVSLSLI